MWLVSPFYDLVFIIFSSVLLVFPHLFSQLGGLSNVVVDLVVTAFIGGPHLFATYTMTFLGPHFWGRDPGYTDRKSTPLKSRPLGSSSAGFCVKKKNTHRCHNAAD